MSPVWGRLAYFTEVGSYAGPAVYLEAQEIGKRSRWNASMSPEHKREFERLSLDGHVFNRAGKHFHWEPALDACRATQLYRTFIHEVGHYIDKTQSIDEQLKGLSDDAPEADAIIDRYWNKPHAEKEAFAHRYAEETASRLRDEGRIPYDRLEDQLSFEEAGLAAKWFMRDSN